MSCATGTNGSHLRCHAFPLNRQVSAEWSRCPSSMARCARESVAPLRWSSTGWMPATIRLSTGVGRRHPVTIRKASLMARSMRRVWALRHQTGAQYSAVEWTRVRVAVRRVVAPTPQPEPASRVKSATLDVNFLRSDSRCRQYVSDLSKVTSRYLGSEQKGRVSLLWLTLSSGLASSLLRWKIADIVFVALNFSFQVWRYSGALAMSLVSTPSTACQSPGPQPADIFVGGQNDCRPNVLLQTTKHLFYLTTRDVFENFEGDNCPVATLLLVTYYNLSSIAMLHWLLMCSLCKTKNCTFNSHLHRYWSAYVWKRFIIASQQLLSLERCYRF